MIWSDLPGNDSVKLSRIYQILNEGMHDDRLAALERELAEARERLSVMTQAVGLATTIKGSMAMRADDPVGMMIEVTEYVKDRVADLEAELTVLRHELGDCPTCDGTGVMSVLVAVHPPDEREEYEDATCAECGGHGQSSYIQMASALSAARAENESLRHIDKLYYDVCCALPLEAASEEEAADVIKRIVEQRAALRAEVERLREGAKCGVVGDASVTAARGADGPGSPSPNAEVERAAEWFWNAGYDTGSGEAFTHCPGATFTAAWSRYQQERGKG